MSFLRWTWPMLLLAFAIGAPWASYRLIPERSLEIAVLDKTVPFQDRREHRSLFWMLDHLKYVKPGGESYDPASDYLGAFPGPQPGDRPARTTPLTLVDAATADVVYLADTYGIYEGDLASGSRMQTALEPSPRIYGGLEPSEARAAVQAMRSGRILVAEFNSMASPTGHEARGVLETALGVRWTGWTGRYFHDLASETEIPSWVRKRYQAHHGRVWDLTGAGYVLIEDEGRVAVLAVGTDTERIGLTIERRRPVDPLLRGARDRIPYPYWFDIVTAEDGTQVLASYHWRLEPDGADKLASLGLPARFPAVCRRVERGGGEGYYFAGDFADNPMPDARVPLTGYLTARRISERFKVGPSETAFYWRFYVPMMRELLDHTSRRLGEVRGHLARDTGTP